MECVKCWKKRLPSYVGYLARQIEERVEVMYFVLLLLAL